MSLALIISQISAWKKYPDCLKVHVEKHQAFKDIILRFRQEINESQNPYAYRFSVFERHAIFVFKDKFFIGQNSAAYEFQKDENYTIWPITNAVQRVLVNYLGTKLNAIKKDFPDAEYAFPTVTTTFKESYFEKNYPFSIETALDNGGFSFTDLNGRILQNGLRVIHNLPPKKFVFHGNICPEILKCDVYNRIKIASLSSIPAQFVINLALGWGSPEAVKYRREKNLMDPSKFNRQYGQKRDTWSLALLIISLIQGSFFYMKGGPQQPLPKVKFIIDRVNLTDLNQLDDSAIGDLTQDEVDREIDELIASDKKHRQWYLVAKHWLVVDPDKRKTVSECFLDKDNCINFNLR